MQIELSQDEVQTLQDALEAWERDASTGNMIVSLFGAILIGDRKNAESERKELQAREKAETVTRERKIKSTMLRARLMQAALQTVTGA